MRHIKVGVIENQTPKVTMQDGYRALCLAMMIRGKIAECEFHPDQQLIYV
jgi:hypothetical protein